MVVLTTNVSIYVEEAACTKVQSKSCSTVPVNKGIDLKPSILIATIHEEVQESDCHRRHRQLVHLTRTLDVPFVSIYGLTKLDSTLWEVRGVLIMHTIQSFQTMSHEYAVLTRLIGVAERDILVSVGWSIPLPFNFC